MPATRSRADSREPATQSGFATDLPGGIGGRPRKRAFVLVRSGGPPGTRTPNLRIKSPLLCQIELEARRSLPTATRMTEREFARAPPAREHRPMSSTAFELRLLGRFAVIRDGEEIPVTAFNGRLPRRLLRVLAVRRGSFVAKDVLVEALWPDRAPADPAANLEVLVSRLRRALGEPDLVRTGSGGYTLADDPRVEVDLEELLEAGDLVRRAESRAPRRPGRGAPRRVTLDGRPARRGRVRRLGPGATRAGRPRAPGRAGGRLGRGAASWATQPRRSHSPSVPSLENRCGRPPPCTSSERSPRRGMPRGRWRPSKASGAASWRSSAWIHRVRRPSCTRGCSGVTSRPTRRARGRRGPRMPSSRPGTRGSSGARRSLPRSSERRRWS